MARDTVPYTRDQVKFRTVHDAVSADVTGANSAKIFVAGAKKINMILTLASIVNRTWTVTPEVSYDNGTTFVAAAMVISNIVNTNAQNYTRTASITNNANGTIIGFIDPLVLGAATHIRFPIAKSDGATPAGTATLKVAIQT